MKCLFIYLILGTKLALSQELRSELIIKEAEWNFYLNNFPLLRNSLQETSDKFKKSLILSNISNHPSTEYLDHDILGTLYSDSSKIIIYMNKSAILNNLYLFSFVLSHEFIHFLLDSEGYPITKRTIKYLNDPVVTQIGTNIQDAVLHYEVYRRQRELGINIEAIPIPVEPFLKYLRNSNFIITPEIEKNIRNILSIEGILSKENSFDKISKLLKILNLSDKLYVSICEN